MGKEFGLFDLFCGAGGSSRGALMAGVVPKGGIDAWGLAAETYALNFPDAEVYRMKAGSLSPHRVLEDIGQIDLLLASPECTNHSVAKGNAPRCEKSRATAFEVVRFAKVLSPRWIIVENVAPMRRWPRFNEWRSKLENLGYKIRVGVLDAKDFGVPQSRRRLFVVCDKKKMPALPVAKPASVKTVASIIGIAEPPDEPWKFSPLWAKGRAPATLGRARRAMRALGSDCAFIMVYYGSDAAGGYQTLNRPLRTVTTLDRFAYVKPNGRGRVMRMLQPPELAAAMGFPDAHVWPDTSRRERIRLIGNAVCPPIMREIVRALIRAS